MLIAILLEHFKMVEKFFICPHCWQNISMLIDISVEKQLYIEDCENCCNPIEIECEVKSNEITYFNAQPIGQ